MTAISCEASALDTAANDLNRRLRKQAALMAVCLQETLANR